MRYDFRQDKLSKGLDVYNHNPYPVNVNLAGQMLGARSSAVVDATDRIAVNLLNRGVLIPTPNSPTKRKNPQNK